jgi:hypothetical protein
MRKEELLSEHAINEEVTHNMEMVALFHSVQERAEREKQRKQRRETRLARNDRAEVDRLRAILKADLEDRGEGHRRSRKAKAMS